MYKENIKINNRYGYIKYNGGLIKAIITSIITGSLNNYL